MGTWRCVWTKQFEIAETYYKRVLAEDALHEVSLRMLMRCLVKLSRSGEALQCYQKFATRLRDEIDVEPERRTRALYERIQSGETRFLEEDGF
jgi:pentatricopeptide repeat protein